MERLSIASKRLVGQKMFQILARAQEMERSGLTVIHMEIGDPDFETPSNISRAACNAIDKGDTHYTDPMGLIELRNVAIEVTEKSRKFRPDLDQVLVTPGANSQLYLALACTVNPGDEVIIPDPSFVSYASIINFLGAFPVRIPLHEENAFRLNPDDVKKAITKKTKMIIINSPSNPTGALMKKEEIDKIFNIANLSNIYLLSDEIYARMVYEDEQTKFYSPSILDQCKKTTIVVNGFSKSYAMTGWRLGVVTGPDDVIQKMRLLLETTFSCVSPFIQRGGIEALLGDQSKIISMMKEFEARRNLLVAGLNSIPGIHCTKPKGAFYVFANIKETGLNSDEMANFLLEKAGVAVSPGTIFGDYGEGYIRLCYAISSDKINQAIKNISKALSERQAR